MASQMGGKDLHREVGQRQRDSETWVISMREEKSKEEGTD